MPGKISRRDVIAGAVIVVAGAGTGVALGLRPDGAATPAATPSASRSSSAGPSRSRSSAPAATATATPPPGSDASPLVRAYVAEARTVETYAALVASLDAPTAGRLKPLLADHRRHLDALAAAAAGAIPGWTPPPAAARTGAKLPSDLPGLERAASAAHLALVAQAAGEDAGLLASIAASEAGHAQLVGILRRAAS